MDPLSFAASLSAMAGVAFQLVSYVNSVKDGSEERKKLGNVLMSLWMALQQLQQQLLSDLGQEDQSWSRSLQILQEPGGIVYQINDALITLQSKLQSKTGGKKLLQSLRWPLDKADVDRATQQILQLHQLLTGVLTQTNLSLARDIRKDGVVVKDLLVGEELQSFLGWLSPLNHPQRKQLIFQQTRVGTGKWFLEDKTYREWEDNVGSILWCPGIPGAGKSFLSSIVLDRLQALQRAQIDKKVVVLMIYFAFDDANSQSSDLIMGSLLKQILQHRSDVPGDLREQFRHHRNTGTRPTHDEIFKALKSELAQFEQIYIVMDALDEVLDESKRRTLVESVMQIKENINLMVTSRPLESIHKIFGPLGSVWCDGCESEAAYNSGGLPYHPFFFHCANCDDEEDQSFDLCSDCYDKGVVSIDPRHERHGFVKRYSSLTIEILARDEDIQSYVEWRIEGNESLRRSVDKKIGLREQILRKVIESARGMFLLARFHMDSLITKLTPRAVIKALETLPTGTDTTYELAMQRINDMNPDHREKANLFLIWVAYTYRPLNVREIEHATTLLMDDTEIDTDEIIPAKILASMCAGLVIIDEMDNVRLCHYTVENYFKKVRSLFFPDSDVCLARTCLTYLLLDDFEIGRCPDREFEHRSKTYPFLGYTASHWGRHLASTTNDSAEQQGLSFLRKESHIEVAVQALWHGQLDDEVADQTWDAKSGVTGLHLASYFGLVKSVESLIADHADLDAQDSAGTTALTYAAQQGHQNVVERLLVAGADPNLMGSQGGNALYRATLKNRVGIVKLLLAIEKLDVNVQSRSSPLIVAAEYGYTDIIQELLKREDIQVNDVGKMGLVGYTALHVAIYYVELEVIKLLLADPRIDYGHRDGSGNPPLILAAIRGEVAIIEMLLNAGADIGQSDSELDGGGTAILRAIDYGQLAAVQLLYKRGADWQCLDRYNRSLIHGAAVNGQSRILRWLLENQSGFDVNLQDVNGKTALHDAAWFGYSDCIKVLLEFHAKTDILNKVGKSPLRTAKERNHTTSYELLKEARDQHIESAKRTNTLLSVINVPLTTAAMDGDIELVQEFIDKSKVDSGIDLNETDEGLESNALSASIYGNHIEIAKMLIEAGINVNLQDRLGRAPIHISSVRNQYAMTKLLIDSNADINLRDQWGKTALMMASNESRPSIVMLLLEHDATIDQPEFDVQIWLFSAAYMGNQSAVKRLLGCGADAQRRDSLGRTPFQLAKLMGFEECAQFLLDFEETKK